MFALGLVEFAVLNLLAASAALSVALRGKFDGRAELALATGLLWNAFVALPIYVLGLTGHLGAITLAVTSGCFSAAVLAISSRRHPAGGVRAFFRAAWTCVRLPFDALRDAWRARSLVLLGLIAGMVLILWTGIASYYTPSWRQWDALWYHEPMVAFTIQNHGFSMVSLPQTGLQKINGYPRLCEMTQLWFVIFTDRRLIDTANSFLAPLLMLVTYLLARRQSGDRVTAMGWAAVVVIMPATSIVLQSSYVDLQTALYVLAAAHFCIRAPLRMRDVWLAAACITMAIGAKILALVPVGLLTLIVLARVLWAHARSRPLAAAATVLGGGGMMAAMAASTYWRNWKYFHNPFWPDLIYDNPRFGIHWPGLSNSVNLNNGDWPTFLDNLTSIPYSRQLGHVTQIYEYGFVIGWFVAPLAALCIVAVLVAAVRALLGKVLRRPSWAMHENTFALLLLIPVLAVNVYLSPALWSARYNVANVAFAAAFVSWAGGRAQWQRLGEGAVVAAMVGTIIAFFWTTPRWWYTPAELLKLAKVPYPAREVTPSASISPALGLASGSGITSEVGLAREKTLGKGATLAFDDNDGTFVALFWNNTYSNRVVYVPSGPDFIARVAQTNAIWLYCSYADPMYSTLHAPSSGWSEVGPLNVEHWGAIFRRTRW